jgi:hypothetical protein
MLRGQTGRTALAAQHSFDTDLRNEVPDQKPRRKR